MPSRLHLTGKTTESIVVNGKGCASLVDQASATLAHGPVAEWLRRWIANPQTPVQFRAGPPCRVHTSVRQSAWLYRRERKTMSISLTSPNGLIPVQLGLYPDNTPVIDLRPALWANYDSPQFNAMVLRPASMQDFFTGMMIVDSLQERGGGVKHLVIPCIPGARQDRLKNEGDMLFTIKYVAKAINAQKFDKVTTVDPHSMATTALIDRLEVYPLEGLVRKVFSSAWPHWDGFISPDQGARARADVFSKEIRMPVFYGNKHRDPETNKLSGFSVDGLENGKHYLVVDDLCDAGGTFLGLAEKIAEAGATADLFVTHGLFTKGTEKLAQAFSNIYSTDSWPILHERVHYINISEGMI